MEKDVFKRVKKQIYSQTRKNVDKFDVKSDGMVIHQDPALNSVENNINIQYDKVSYIKRRYSNTYLTADNFSGDGYNISRMKLESLLGNVQLYPSQYENIMLSVNLFSNRKTTVSFDISVRDCNVTVYQDDSIVNRIVADEISATAGQISDTSKVTLTLYKNSLLRIYIYSNSSTSSFKISGDLGKQIDQYSGTDITPFTIPVIWATTNPISFGLFKDGNATKPYVTLNFELDDSDYKDQSIGGFGIYTIDFSKDAGTIIEATTTYIRVDGKYYLDKYIKVDSSITEVTEYYSEYYDSTSSVTTVIYTDDASGFSIGQSVYIGYILHKDDYDIGGNTDQTNFSYTDYNVNFGDTYYYLLNTYDDSINKNRSELTDTYESITLNDNTVPDAIVASNVEVSDDGATIHCYINNTYNEPDDIYEYRWWFALGNTFPTGSDPDRVGKDIYFTAHKEIPYYIFVVAYDVFGNHVDTSTISSITPSGYEISGINHLHTDLNDIFAQDITVEGQIHGNKTLYTDTVSGWWIGKDTDGEYKINIGDSTHYINWDGSTLDIAGDINILNPGDIDASTINNDIGWDGKVVGFYQDDEPTSGMSFGDIWIDTDGSWSGVDNKDIAFYECDPLAKKPIDYYRSPIIHYYNGKTFFIRDGGTDIVTSYESDFIDVYDHSTKSFYGGAQTIYNKNSQFNDFTIDETKLGIGGNKYTSDFSADYDSWIGVKLTREGNVDGIGGEDDTLKATSLAYTGDYEHYLRHTIYNLDDTNTMTVRITAKVYLPSTNSIINGVRIQWRDGYGTLQSGTTDVTTTDSWVDVELIYSVPAASYGYIYAYALNNGNRSFANSNATDVFYLKDVVVDTIGIVAHYEFDDFYHTNENTGQNILYDLTGNGNNLTASSGFDYTNQMTGTNPGYYKGTSVEFDGTDDRAYNSGEAFQPGENDFSIVFWFNTSVAAGDYHVIAETYNGSTPNWQLIIDPTSAQLRFVAYDGTNTVSLLGNSVNDGNDHLAIAIRNGSNFYLYDNGTLVASTTATIGSISNNNELSIGQRYGGTLGFVGHIASGSYINKALTSKEITEIYSLGKYWSWDGTGSISNNSFTQVVSGGGTVSQSIAGLDSSVEYRYSINGSNNDTFITGVTDYTISLTDGTYSMARLSDVYPIDIGPYKWGDDIHNLSSMELTNDGYFLVAYDPLADDGEHHNYGPYIKRSTTQYSVKQFSDIGYLNYNDASTQWGGSYPQFARGSGDAVFVFAMGEGDGQPQYTTRMAKSDDNGQTWGYAYDISHVSTDTAGWAYHKVLDHEPGGWVRLAIHLQDHTFYKITDIYIIKTKNGETWYNEDETFSKNVVTSGYITPTELDNNCLLYHTDNNGTYTYTYLVYSSAVDKNDKLYLTVYRYSYADGARTLYFMYSNGSGSWYKRTIAILNQPTYGALIANDDDSFTLINVNNESKTLDVLKTKDYGQNWHIENRLIDLSDSDNSLGYMFNTVSKRSQDKYSILVQKTVVDNGVYNGYNDFYLLTFDKETVPTVDDIYRYEDINGNNESTLAWRPEPESGIGNNFLKGYNAQSSTDKKATIYYQSSEPINSNLKYNDIWIDTGSTYKVYVYNGNSWVPASHHTYRQDTEPTDNLSIGDIWIDTSNNNKPWVWDGSQWQASRDTFIADENGLIKLPVSPQGSGLHLGSTNLGYFDGAGWVTYMDNSGNFYLSGSGGYLTWISDTSSLEIKGTIYADSGDIGTWHITNNLLSSATSGARIELNPYESRISIFDTTDEKIVMGYLDGLQRNNAVGSISSISGSDFTDSSKDWQTNELTGLVATFDIDSYVTEYTITSNTSDTITISGTVPSTATQYKVKYTSDDYGFWALDGDRLKIDGDVQYNSGDWIVQHNGAFRVLNGSGYDVLRMGTYNSEKGFFVFDGTSGSNILAKLISDEIFIGETDKYLQYTTTNGLKIKGEITATTGSFTGGISIDSGGSIAGGKTSYTDSTAGFWLGDDSGTYKFTIGDSTSSLDWDGSGLNISGAEISSSSDNEKIVLNPSNNSIDFYLSGLLTARLMSYGNGDVILYDAALNFGTLYLDELNSNFVDTTGYTYWHISRSDEEIRLAKVVDSSSNRAYGLIAFDSYKPYFQLKSDDTFEGFDFKIYSETGDIYLYGSSLGIDGSYLFPKTNNNTQLGTSTTRWSNLYSVNANISGTATIATAAITTANISGTYQMDGSDIIDSSGYQTGTLKTRQLLLFGYNTTISGSTTVDGTTIDGSTNGYGYRVFRSGKISGFSVQFNVINQSTHAADDDVIIFTIQKNGSNTTMSLELRYSSSGAIDDAGGYTTSNSFTVVAGDKINIEIQTVDGSGGTDFSVDDIAIVVEYEA